MPDQSPDVRTVAVQVDVPAATTSSAPQKTTIDLGDVYIIEAELRVPQGHNGLTGIALVYDGQGLFPWATPVAYIVGNAETIKHEIGFPVGHAAQFWAYNTGAYQHSFYWRLKVQDSVLTTPEGSRGPVLVRTDL